MKAYTFYNFYFALVSLLFLNSCVFDPVDKRKLKITNKSNEVVYMIRSNSNLKPPDFNDDIDTIQIDSCILLRPSGFWEESIKRSTDKRLKIYIIPKDTVLKYGLKAIYKKQIFAKRYLIDMDYLTNNNWAIVYK